MGTDTAIIRTLSFSKLACLYRSPAELKAYMEKKVEPTPAIMEGRALDCLLFTPEEFEKDFFVWPENGPKKPTSAQINAAKPAEKTVQQIQEYNALIEIVGDRYVLSKETFETIVAQVRAVEACSTVKRWRLTDRNLFEFQQPVEFERGGFLHYGRMDAFGCRADGVTCIWDLKRAANKSGEREIKWKIRNELLDLQAAIYCYPYDEAGKPVEYYVIAVSESGIVTPVRISEHARRATYDRWDALIAKAKHINFTGDCTAGPEAWAEWDGFFTY